MQHILKTYDVIRTKKSHFPIQESEKDSFWNQANLLTDFINPWAPNPDTGTIFRAVWDDTHLYFRFDVIDNSIHIDESHDDYESINVSDRVELFFRPNETLNPYYCLEIDSKARVMDFKARPQKMFDLNWHWPSSELVVNASSSNAGYYVEGALSIKSLKFLKLINKNCIETGVFRAKYYKQKDGRFEPSWITWIDPKTDAPNFHVPTSFGLLRLKKY